MTDKLKEEVLSGLFWSYLTRLGSQIVSFVVSVIIARILMPSDYGLMAIVLVFIHLSNVFVDGGFGNALIQKKAVDERDRSSVFWLSAGVSAMFYLLLFVSAPWIAWFYEMQGLCPLLRVLGIALLIAPYNTVQRSIVSRSMQFRIYFYSSLVGVIISAIAGIYFAYAGAGTWALVIQQLSNTLIGTIVIAYFIKWHPRFLFDIGRIKGLFSYGWKLLVGVLIDAVYDDFRNLYVGKLYTPADLAYYSKGKSFPSLIVDNVNSSIMAVLFPALSRKQDDREIVRNMVRRSIRTSSFVIIPLMFGLIAIAKSLVLVLLTEKWLPCVVFVQILCLDVMLMPIQTSNLQAIYAMGRSDIGLKLNIIKKSVGFVIILTTATFSVEAMAWGSVASAIFASLMNTYPNRRLLDYGYLAQMKDILPFVMLAAVMGCGVWLVGLLPIGNLYILLMLQILTGVSLYLGLSWLFQIETLDYILSILSVKLKRVPK